MAGKVSGLATNLIQLRSFMSRLEGEGEDVVHRDKIKFCVTTTVEDTFFLHHK